MTSFTILTHGNDPPAEASVGVPAPPPGAKRRPIPLEPARTATDVGGLEDAALPEVVLQLPDLKTSVGWTRGVRLPVATALYWVALILGGLLALWLITSGRKSASQSTSEAPAWNQQSPTQPPNTSGTWGQSPINNAPPMPRWQASGSSVNSNSSQPPVQAPQGGAEPVQTPMSPGESPDAVAPQGPAFAPFDAAQSTPVSGDIRTARGGETRWDGTSRAVQPGEAAPLGISPSVP